MDKTKSSKKSSVPGGGKSKQTIVPSKNKSGKKELSLTGSGAQSNNVTSTSQQINDSNCVEHFVLIWLDSNIDESNEDYYNSLIKFRHTVNTIYTFNDADKCVDFVIHIKNSRVFMITSGTLGERVISHVHPMSQLVAVYIFCGNKPKHELWAKKWSKVRGVYTELTSICEALKRDARHCDQSSIKISFVPNCDVSNEDLNQLDQSFMYTQLLKEILLKLDYSEQSRKDFITFLRSNEGNDQKMIDEFESKYGESKAVYWYTTDTIIYRMLNNSLRTQAINEILSMGFFIRDLHQNIQRLHDQQWVNYEEKVFLVYRGQHISKKDLVKIKKGGLMAFNNFLSTSRMENVARTFAFPNKSIFDSCAILFTMTINASTSSTPFASIKHYSDFSEEEEILFSMHAVFRIGEIECEEETQLWKVTLELTTDNDPQLTALTNRLQVETQGANERYRLGVLLIKLSDFTKAAEVFEALLHRSELDKVEEALLYYHLGNIKNNQQNYDKALEYYGKTLEIYEKKPRDNRHNLASTYNNIGLVHNKKCEYSNARQFYKKALDMYQTIYTEDDPVFATCYNNIGSTYYEMGKYSEALVNYKLALDICEKTLPAYHLDRAICCNNMALTHERLKEYSKALPFYELALKIGQRTLRPNHPTFQMYERNLELFKKKNRK